MGSIRCDRPLVHRHFGRRRKIILAEDYTAFPKFESYAASSRGAAEGREIGILTGLGSAAAINWPPLTKLAHDPKRGVTVRSLSAMDEHRKSYRQVRSPSDSGCITVSQQFRLPMSQLAPFCEGTAHSRPRSHDSRTQ